MIECRWWDSNPHGFPNDFESFASAIPPHRLIFNFGTLVPVFEDWRDVQEECKKSCFDKPSKFNAHSWISRTDTENHEGDFESFASAIPPHRRTSLLYRIRPAKSSADFSRGIRKKYTPLFARRLQQKRRILRSMIQKQKCQREIWAFWEDEGKV